MNTIKLALICTTIALLSFACNQGAAPTNSPQPASAASPVSVAKATPNPFAAAHVAYQKNCEACHGETGEGGVVKVDNKRLKVPSLKSDHAIKHSDEDLTKQITAGGDGMPAFKDKLKQEEIHSLVQMIRKEFQGK
jgi:mono/diheme cytochrome c family protein